MMHPRFFDMVALAAGRKIKVSTNTNLTLLNPQRAERCVTSGLATLHFSLDAATAATYERIRVRSHFDRVLKNLQLLLDTRRRLDSATPHVRLVVVAMRQNLHEFPALVRLAHAFGILEVFVQHLCHEYGEDNLPMPISAHARVRARAKPPRRGSRRASSAFLTRRAKRPKSWGSTCVCHLPSRAFMPGHRGPPAPAIGPGAAPTSTIQGRALPCCMVSSADRIQLGNMAEAGAAPVWNGPAYQSFRAQLV